MGFIIDTPPGFGVEVRSESFIIHGPAEEVGEQEHVEMYLHQLVPLISALVEAAARGGDRAIPQPNKIKDEQQELLNNLVTGLRDTRETILKVINTASNLEEKL